ncbi:hypothetical protein GCM10022629_30560 [Amorphoplanes auranticolor]
MTLSLIGRPVDQRDPGLSVRTREAALRVILRTGRRLPGRCRRHAAGRTGGRPDGVDRGRGRIVG